jgi:hypothetical protein
MNPTPPDPRAAGSLVPPIRDKVRHSATSRPPRPVSTPTDPLAASHQSPRHGPLIWDRVRRSATSQPPAPRKRPALFSFKGHFSYDKTVDHPRSDLPCHCRARPLITPPTPATRHCRFARATRAVAVGMPLLLVNYCAAWTGPAAPSAREPDGPLPPTGQLPVKSGKTIQTTTMGFLVVASTMATAPWAVIKGSRLCQEHGHVADGRFGVCCSV